MAYTIFQILPAPDDDIIRAFETIWERLGANPNSTYSITLMENGTAQPINGQMTAIGSDQNVAALRASRVVSTYSLLLSIPEQSRFSVQVERVPQQVFNNVRVNLQDNIDPSIVANALVIVRSAFARFDSSPAADAALGPALAEFYKRRESSLIELESLSERVIEQNVSYRRQLDAQLQEERQRLHKEIELQREELEADRRRREALLEGREEAIAAERKQIDNSNNRTARRKLREDLKKVLADRSAKFTLSTETEQKRAPIHWLFGLWIAVSGLLVIAEIEALNADAPWPALVKFGVGVISAISAIVFYIRWNDAWFRQHATEEFRMRRLDLDVDRASWVVETALEWKEEQNGAIPAELLNRLTQNLFVLDDTKAERARHPAEDVSALLFGASSAMKLKFGENEVSLDRRGVRKLQKVAESNGDGE